MEIISNHKRSKVYYNKGEDKYIKTFHPKLKNRLKYSLRLRKSPGENFNFISEKLNEIGLETPKVLEYSKYSVVTKKVDGVLLRDYIDKDPSIVKTFLNSIILMIKNGIHCGDFNTGNFIVSDGKIYVLDLEDYRRTTIFPREKEGTMKRLRNTLKNDKWVDYISKEIG